MPTAKKPLIDEHGEVRELTASDMARFRPAQDMLPPSLQGKTGMRRRGPQKAPTKERITIRLTPEVVKVFRDTGDGWQRRIDEALKDWLSSHEPGR